MFISGVGTGSWPIIPPRYAYLHALPQHALCTYDDVVGYHRSKHVALYIARNVNSTMTRVRGAAHAAAHLPYARQRTPASAPLLHHLSPAIFSLYHHHAHAPAALAYATRLILRAARTTARR